MLRWLLFFSHIWTQSCRMRNYQYFKRWKWLKICILHQTKCAKDSRHADQTKEKNTKIVNYRLMMATKSNRYFHIPQFFGHFSQFKSTEWLINENHSELCQIRQWIISVILSHGHQMTVRSATTNDSRTLLVIRTTYKYTKVSFTEKKRVQRETTFYYATVCCKINVKIRRCRKSYIKVRWQESANHDAAQWPYGCNQSVFAASDSPAPGFTFGFDGVGTT